MKVIEKHRVRIPDFPTQIQVSKKRKASYWKQGDKIPKKYQNYTYASGFLVDPAGNKVVKNTKTAGKPRFIPINSQLIYVGLHHSVRGIMVDELHTLFHNAFKAQLPKTIDLGDNKVLIHLNFHDVLTRNTRDLDNLSSLFFKCGIDCLTKPNNPNQVKSSGYSHKLGIIGDDTIYFIPIIVVEFTPIEEFQQRFLDFNIFIVSKDFHVENLLNKELEMFKMLPNAPL